MSDGYENQVSGRDDQLPYMDDGFTVHELGHLFGGIFRGKYRKMIKLLEESPVDEQVKWVFIKRSVVLFLPLHVLEMCEPMENTLPYLYLKQLLRIRRDLKSGRPDDLNLQEYSEGLRQIGQIAQESLENDDKNEPVKNLVDELQIFTDNIELLVDIMREASD